MGQILVICPFSYVQKKGFSYESFSPNAVYYHEKYSKEQFIKDVISGIIVAIIALPLSIALALASGVGPEQGLYTAIIAGFLISFFGGSTVQIAGQLRLRRSLPES